MFSTTSKNHKNKDLPQLIFRQLNIFLCKNQFNQLFKNETSTITNSYIPWRPINVPFLWQICRKKYFSLKPENPVSSFLLNDRIEYQLNKKELQ
jgi:hypothetical protein